jgi:hypothetical protein
MSKYTRFKGLSVTDAVGYNVGGFGAETQVISGTGTSSLGLSTQTLTSATTIAFNPNSGYLATLTPAHTITMNFTAGTRAGQICVLKVLTSGTTSYTITFGTNTKSTATLASGTVDAKIFTVLFMFDGTNWLEVSRTAAM